MQPSRRPVLVLSTFLVLAATSAGAASLKRARSFSGVDWVSAGVGGIGGDTADIALTGVTGPVTKAFLYWDGINVHAADAVYDNANLTLNGNPVVGTSLGDSSSNCWGPGTSRAYVADVTAYVTGDGTYSLTGLAGALGKGANGVSLVVMFDDGDPSNDRDLVFYEGNDANRTDNYSGPPEDGGWHARLDGITYGAGTANLQLHVADGQATVEPKPALVVSSAFKSLAIDDTPTLFDGNSVQSAGASRAPDGDLWDINTLDISAVFKKPGPYTLAIDTVGGNQIADCTALIVAIVELVAPPPPVCGDGVVTAGEECDDGNTTDGDCCDHTCHFEPVGTVCGNAGDPCLESRCDGAGTCDLEGDSCRMPVATEGARLIMRQGAVARMRWLWATGVSTVEDFGDPLGTTTYDLCVYDKGTGSVRLLEHATLAPTDTCDGVPCWTSTSNGFTYHNAAGTVQDVTLRGGLPGQARIVARSAGGSFGVPAMPLAPPVFVRLQARNGLCWAARYSTPERNGSRRFRARSDFTPPRHY
jgi:cysteine-rich repeat protein